MRLLFTLDTKDYDRNARVYVRPSVRGILIRGGRVGMVYSMKYAYYKFPGGGIEDGESQTDALIREVAEEAGLAVIPGTIREYGYVHRIQKGERETVFIQDNYYYFCEAEAALYPQRLEEYEADERFTLRFVDPMQAITANRAKGHGPKDPVMLEREARVLELLLREGRFHPDSV